MDQARTNKIALISSLCLLMTVSAIAPVTLMFTPVTPAIAAPAPQPKLWDKVATYIQKNNGAISSDLLDQIKKHVKPFTQKKLTAFINKVQAALNSANAGYNINVSSTGDNDTTAQIFVVPKGGGGVHKYTLGNYAPTPPSTTTSTAD